MEKIVQNKIDDVWNTFFAGGVANPLTVIEQITYLLFMKALDEVETNNEQTEQILGVKFNRIFDEKHQDCRWSIFKNVSANEMFKTVSERVFPFIKSLQPSKESSFSRYMESAIFVVPTPLVLEKVVTKLDSIPMKERDTKGDVYEYMLSKLSTSGDLGQFRTPRHIIKMMVELIKPTPNDIICDPACGSGGFLVEVGEYLREEHKELFETESLKHHYNNSMFYGFDTDSTMLRIGAMNMMLHGIDNPNIDYKDSVSEDNADEEKYSVILANPPFKGTIDTERTSPDLLKICNTKKTELLFLALFLRTLKIGGRCACIVPDGVLFGSSNAHKSIRKEIVENNKLEAIISMPSGVFQPYAGVSTAIMIFTKTTTGGTDKVWFYDMTADGFSLDAKRTKVKENDIPDIIERYNNLDKETERSRTDKSFFVTKEEIASNDYDLSINKYKEIVQEKVEYLNDEDYVNYKNLLLEELVDIVNSFNTLKFDVKQKIKYVEKYKDIVNWNNLTDLAVKEIKDNLTSLIMSNDNDESAKQFDRLMLAIELSKMLNIKYERESGRLNHIGEGLLGLMNVPQVQVKSGDVHKIIQDSYVKRADIFEIDRIRNSLRELIKYLPKRVRKDVYTDFSDDINIVEHDDRRIEQTELSDYKKKMNFYLRNHMEDEIINKIRNNEKISSEEINQLQNILFNELNSNSNEYKMNYNDESLVLLVRKTVGLSKEAIDREFSKYINENELNVQQTRFINLIKNYIMKNGVIDKRILNEDPFTSYGSILQIFDGQMNIIQIIIMIIDLINRNGCFNQE